MSEKIKAIDATLGVKFANNIYATKDALIRITGKEYTDEEVAPYIVDTPTGKMIDLKKMKIEIKEKTT